MIRSLVLTILTLGYVSSAEADYHIATLEHESPSVTSYKIKATIPVPEGTFLEQDMLAGVSPFSIQDSDGSIRNLQVTGITKYPNLLQDGYDLVSVVGSVKKQNTPSSIFKVFNTPNQGPSWPSQLPATANELVQDAPLTVHPNILSLFTTTNKLIAEAQDVFGHPYKCDLGGGAPKIYGYGSEQLVFRAGCMLTPVNPVVGNQGTLPHLMGVLGYFVINANEEAMRLTLVATNSVSGAPLNGGSNSAVALKDIFFKFLNLKINGDYGTKYV
jgi:hypothetical protein